MPAGSKSTDEALVLGKRLALAIELVELLTVLRNVISGAPLLNPIDRL